MKLCKEAKFTQKKKEYWRKMKSRVKFADGTKLEKTVNKLKGRAATQCRVWRNGQQKPDEIQQGQMLRPTHGKGDHIVMILAEKRLCLKVLKQFAESELGDHELNGTYWY